MRGVGARQVSLPRGSRWFLNSRSRLTVSTRCAVLYADTTTAFWVLQVCTSCPSRTAQGLRTPPSVRHWQFTLRPPPAPTFHCHFTMHASRVAPHMISTCFDNLA